MIRAFFSNKTPVHFTALNMQVAVQKYMKIAMELATSTELPPLSQGQVHQDMRIHNSMQGQKPNAIKIRVIYTNTQSGQKVEETKVINALPSA